MAYSLTLSDHEIETLNWLSVRGYFPTLLSDKMTLKEGQPDFDTLEPWDIVSHEGKPVTVQSVQREYTIPEFAAWALTELRESDPDAYLACLGGDLLTKILKLENEIV